jgi:hypothetical protein
MKREQATSPEPNNTAPTLLRLRRNTVHGSRTSPRTVLLDRKFNYLSVRPALVEGLRVNCDTVSLRGGLCE